MFIQENKLLRPESYNCRVGEDFLPGVLQMCGAPLSTILLWEVGFISRTLILGSFRGDESISVVSHLLMVKRLLRGFLMGCWDFCTHSNLQILFVFIIHVYIHTAVFVNSETSFLDADTGRGFGLVLYHTGI